MPITVYNPENGSAIGPEPCGGDVSVYQDKRLGRGGCWRWKCRTCGASAEDQEPHTFPSEADAWDNAAVHLPLKG